jgi:hypothetical protein
MENILTIAVDDTQVTVFNWQRSTVSKKTSRTPEENYFVLYFSLTTLIRSR